MWHSVGGSGLAYWVRAPRKLVRWKFIVFFLSNQCFTFVLCSFLYLLNFSITIMWLYLLWGVSLVDLCVFIQCFLFFTFCLIQRRGQKPLGSHFRLLGGTEEALSVCLASPGEVLGPGNGQRLGVAAKGLGSRIYCGLRHWLQGNCWARVGQRPGVFHGAARRGCG